MKARGGGAGAGPTLAAALLLVVQIAVGMVVNLYVAVPARHPGARPSNYASGSLASLGWALAHGAAALVVHTALGLALAVLAVLLALRAARAHERAATVLTGLAAAFVIGAGFNGASFLDFAHNANSLVMALLSLAALACYLVVLPLTARRPERR